jgi:hypothetical protein
MEETTPALCKNPEFRYESHIQLLLQCMNMPRPEDSYNYAVYSGMPEWAELTHEERSNHMSVPECIVGTLSTQALIQAICEDWNFFWVAMRFQYQRDFQTVFFKTAVYKELGLREDAGKCLLERLMNAKVGATCFYLNSLQVFLSQTPFLYQLDERGKKLVIKTAFEQDELRTGDFNRQTAWMLIGRTLFTAEYPPFIEEMSRNRELNLYVRYGDYVYLESLGEIGHLIIDYGKEYIHEL